MNRPAGFAWHPAWIWALGLLALFTVAIQYTQPVRDGDLWWQMAYGRYLLEHRTLIPDHTAFTWTPAASGTVYCAWLPEIMLYLIHRAAGLTPLFIIQYLCLLLFLATLAVFARRAGVLRHPAVGLIAVLGVLMVDTAIYIKPELFSLVAMTLMAANWMHLKTTGERAWRWVYAFPILLLLWVNSHGGVIFGVFFLALLGLGEWLNARFSPATALPPRVRRHLWIALALCVPALLMTPYLLRYPLHLLRALPAKDMDRMQTIRAYMSIFDERVAHLHFPDYLILATITLGAAAWRRLRRERFDWAILILNVAFGFLYTRLLRTTYYWVPIFALSAIYLLGHRTGPLWPRRRPLALALAGLITLVALGCTARVTYEQICRPSGARWIGFGISYHNPVAEAEYVARYFPDRRLGNDYASGGYLLWQLAPETKIMIDPRQFPFDRWYDEYTDFSLGRNVEKFLKEFPFDVGCFALNRQNLVAWFQRSGDWRLAYYGPVAAIFVHKDVPIPDAAPRVAEGIDAVRNLSQALLVLRFAVTVGDWETGERVLASMNARFHCPNQCTQTRAAGELFAGSRAYFSGDYETAARHLRTAHDARGMADTGLLLRTYNHLTVAAWQRKDERAALAAAEQALTVKPDDPYALYNAGVLEWYLAQAAGARAEQAPSRVSSFDKPPHWPQRLRQFTTEARARPDTPGQIVADAESILSGTFQNRPKLAADPPLPPRGQP